MFFITASTPYNPMPRIMIKANLEEKVYWHTILTPKYYITQVIGPAGMILGQDKPD